MIQFNTLGFYSSMQSRVWEKNKGNRELYRIFFPTGVVPAVQLIVPDATTATIDVIGETVVSTFPMTIEGTDYKKLIFLGDTIVAEDGDYYLRVTIDGVEYYSDVFGWTGQTDELLKVRAESSNIRIGRDYILNLDNFIYECYVNAEYLGITPETTDSIDTINGINKVLHGNVIPVREFDIYGCEYIFKFLLGLRMLEGNGKVDITWDGITYSANDIQVEKSEEHSPELMYQISLKFTDINEIIGISNKNVL